MSKMPWGVTIVICCHNSSERLPKTLAHLAAQQISEESVPWEVIVIDNGSTDQTARVALAQWPASTTVPLRVVYEPQLGLSHARRRGFREARFELVSFIDDDNWVCPGWVETVSVVMRQQPTVGACGGWITAVCESAPPPWFERYAEKYAVGQQAAASGDVTVTRGFLWGAGLTIRQAAWQQLLAAGFRPVLLGRQGAKLTAGEDSEICFALRLAGWRLWYDRRLTVTHYLPAQRLEWSYLRRLYRGFGASFALLDAYLVVLPRAKCSAAERSNNRSSVTLSSFKQRWPIKTVGCLGRALIEWGKWRLAYATPLASEQALLQCEFYWGKFVAMLRLRRTYVQAMGQIQTLAATTKKAIEFV